jgi:hypothetical protein
MPRKCSGLGDCLQQQDDGTYSELFKDADTACEHNCKPVSCPNGLVCGNYMLPAWTIIIKGTGVCIDCHYNYHKKLDFVESTDCPICFETTTCVIQPKCTHPTCISCFKRGRYGDPSPPPPFPYSDEVENEWNEIDDNDPAFHARYPLLRKWLQDCERHDDIESIKWQKEKSLRVCPLCRQ